MLNLYLQSVSNYGNTYGLSNFQAGGTKLKRVLPKNQHAQRNILNFENWCNGEVSKIEHRFGN